MVSRKFRWLPLVLIAMAAAAVPVSVGAAPPLPGAFSWSTVVNNTDGMPGAPFYRKFNSYNQPSVNAYWAGGHPGSAARRRGSPGDPRDLHARHVRGRQPHRQDPGPDHQVPHPNNGSQSTIFVETPSFPRIDMWSDTIATRGNHQPVYRYNLSVDEETRVGTTGIYSNPFGGLITGASKLGAVPGFDCFEVPGADPWTVFDVFPGAPSVTDGKTIVFKGNYTAGGAHKTGVFYRNLEDAEHGGFSPVELIANNTDTLIPGTRTPFGSTSPPSAAGGKVVFAGFDNEETPSLGGLYMADLRKRNNSRGLSASASASPGSAPTITFTASGKASRSTAATWDSGALDAETEYRTMRLYCPTEGNKDRIAYCNRSLVCADTDETAGDPDSVCDDTGCYQEKRVPVRQGIFVHDTREREYADGGDDRRGLR